MTEQQYLDCIKSMIPDEGDVPLEALRLLEDALREHPTSERLWITRGHLIQLSVEGPYELEDALASYHEALRMNPHSIEVHQEIGHYYDAVMNDEQKAREWFSKAEELKRGR
ncbi:MAG: hypothetical protein A2Z25_17435 [Planctomycetes bacterium RBG_16_55_9]|nr:MAG: hypothetical protein A2Z25_17435 [Planctomycetes bacterium RBG_16_55_9]